LITTVSVVFKKTLFTRSDRSGTNVRQIKIAPRRSIAYYARDCFLITRFVCYVERAHSSSSLKRIAFFPLRTHACAGEVLLMIKLFERRLVKRVITRETMPSGKDARYVERAHSSTSWKRIAFFPLRAHACAEVS
jgi:hypothetical protein